MIRKFKIGRFVIYLEIYKEPLKRETKKLEDFTPRDS